MIPSDYNARRYEIWADRHGWLDGLLRLVARCVWLLTHPVSLMVVGLALVLGMMVGCPVQFDSVLTWRCWLSLMGVACVILGLVVCERR